MTHAAEESHGRKPLPRPDEPRPRSYEEQLYAALARPGDVCFDVGANQGHVSLFLAQVVGQSGMVVAFEAVWPMYSELCRNVQYDTIPRSPIIPVPAGLADSERDAPIHVPKGLFEEGSMAEAAAWGRAHAGAEIDVYRARLTTIDSFFSMTGMPPPTFLKIDVEGAELFALRGAAGLFSSGHRPLMLIEVFAPWEKAFGYKPWELFSWLLEWGYRFLFACPSGLVEYLPNESRPFPQEYAMGYNVLAHSPAAHAMRVDGVKHLRAGPLAKLLPMVPPPFPNHTD